MAVMDGKADGDAAKYLTKRGVCAWLDLPPGTVDTLVFRRQIPHVRLGKRLVRFPVADLEEWIRQRMVSPTGGR